MPAVPPNPSMSPTQDGETPRSGARHFLLAAFLLALLSFVLFFDVLVLHTDTIASSARADMNVQFIHWRQFGFNELRNGNLPFWNPHIYSGAHYFGGFQGALLYPPNWIFLVLPLRFAINLSMAFHVFLLGFLMYAWAVFRRLSFPASLLAAAGTMFGGAYFLHVYGGHLSNVCTMAWIPLLFLAVDACLQPVPDADSAPESLPKSLGGILVRKRGWIALGALAVSLQILAGHTQYLYYSGLAVSVYAMVRMIADRNWRRAAVCIPALYVLAAALTAVQWLPGLEALSENVRRGGLPLPMARMFSFPPEAFLTFLAPAVFGNDLQVPYWGRWFVYEMVPFFGVTGLILALRGVTRGDRQLRRAAIPTILLLTILALGSYTPLFPLFYHGLPGFALFRGQSKLMFYVALFLTLLAGSGLDSLPGLRTATASTRPELEPTASDRHRRGKKSGSRRARPDSPRPSVRPNFFPWVPAGIGLALGLAALFVAAQPVGPGGAWSRWVARVYATGQTYLSRGDLADPEFLRTTARGAAISLGIAAAICLILAGLLYVVVRQGRSLSSERRRRWAVYGAVILGIVEIFAFARLHRPTFVPGSEAQDYIEQRIATRPEDERVLCAVAMNLAMSIGAYDIWGSDPYVSRRYAEFMTFTQGGDADEASQNVNWKGPSPLLRLVRCTQMFLLDPATSRLKPLRIQNPLPRLLLVHDYVQIDDRDEIFQTLNSPEFDPQRTVILQEEPDPIPQPNDSPAAAAGRDSPNEYARLLDEDTDTLFIEATLESPGILVITDGYSRLWRARAMEPDDLSATATDSASAEPADGSAATPPSSSTQTKYAVLPANYILRGIPLQAGHHRVRVEFVSPGFRVGRWISALAWAGLIVVGVILLVRRRRVTSASPNPRAEPPESPPRTPA